MSEIRQSKKRSRIALSCNYCRKRKVKCDRGKPCSSCARYKVGHLCDYPEPMWAESGTDDESGGSKQTAPRIRNDSKKPNIGVLPTFSIQKMSTPSVDSQNKRHTSQPEQHTITLQNHQNQNRNHLNQNQNHHHDAHDIQARQVLINQQNQALPKLPNPSIPQSYQLSRNVFPSYPSYPSVGLGSTPVANATIPINSPNSEQPALQTELDLLKEKIKDIEAILKKENERSPAPNFRPVEVPPVSNNSLNGSAPLAGPLLPMVSRSPGAASDSPGPVYHPVGGIPNYTGSPAPFFQSTGTGTPATSNNPSNIDYNPGLGPNINKFLPNQPSQLPPLNWNSRPNFDPTDPPNDDPSINSKHSSQTKETINSDRTYVGINPYASEEEHINLYDVSNPIYIKDSSRRMNFGPFAWFSLINKDVGLLSMWKYMLISKSYNLQRAKMHKKGDVAENFRPFVPIYDDNESCIYTKKSDSTFRDKAIERDGFNELRYYADAEKEHARSSSQSANTKSSDTESKSENTQAKETNEKDSEKKQFSPNNQYHKIALNKNAIAFGLTAFENKLDHELKLIDKIRSILPKKKVIWLLIKIYFSELYPFLPFLDEEWFRSEARRMLGPESEEDVPTELKVEKRLDFAILGILLVMLRLSYLSLFSNNSSENENNAKTTDPSEAAQNIKYLLGNPIGPNLAEMAQLCLDQFELLRKINMVVLQCALFIRYYHALSPEEGDGSDGGDSQIYNGMLIQMAYSLGLNREPDYIDELSKDHKNNSVGRKIWMMLMMGDLAEAYKYGCPLIIDKKYYDTKLPYATDENSNICDKEVEKVVVSAFPVVYEFYWRIVKVLKLSLNIGEPPLISELTECVTELENYIATKLISAKHYVKPFDKEVFPLPCFKILSCRYYLQMKGFLLTVYFHLQLYYEKIGKFEFSYFYLRKISSIIHYDLIPAFFPLILNNKVNFSGNTADLMLNPAIESIIHKVNQLLVSVMIRVNSRIFKLKNDPSHSGKLKNDYKYKVEFSKLCKFAKLQETSLKYCMAAMSHLSQRYYYAWRVPKAYTFLLKLIRSEEFYVYSKDRNVDLIPVNGDELDELISISAYSARECKKTRVYNASDLFDDIADADSELGDKAKSKNTKSNLGKTQSNANQADDDSAPAPESESKMNSPGANANHHQERPKNGGQWSSQSNVNTTYDGQTPSIPNFLNDSSINPPSVESGKNSDFDEFQFIENAEIDKLWLQMSNMKNDTNGVMYNTNEEQAENENGSANNGASTNGGVFNGYGVIPTPLNPLSPDSLNNNLQAKNQYDSPYYSMTIDNINSFPIDQLLGIDGTYDTW